MAPGRESASNTPSRIAVTRRRARSTKGAMILAAGGSFIILVPLARSHHAGKPLPKPTPLAAPAGFVSSVRQNLLQAGVIAPPVEAPVVSSGVS